MPSDLFDAGVARGPDIARAFSGQISTHLAQDMHLNSSISKRKSSGEVGEGASAR